MLHVWDGWCTDGRWSKAGDVLDEWRVFDWPGCPGRGFDGSIKAGDVLGLLLNYDEGGSQMSVYLNGTRCGVMLRLDDGLWDEFTPFYWAVDVTGGSGSAGACFSLPWFECRHPSKQARAAYTRVVQSLTNGLGRWYQPRQGRTQAGRDFRDDTRSSWNTCGDCGRPSDSGGIDDADGVWYCQACWAATSC